jgi:deazaflavin-dependent oxidoreductase (nitroreductase family)
MAKTYQLTPFRRFVNTMMKLMLRWNIAPADTYLLTVRGRKSGKRYSTPVSLIEEDSRRWLVSPYGEVSWVKNARAAGEVRLSRGGKTETVAIHELGPAESAPILKTYITEIGIVRPYFDVKPDSSLEAFEAEAPRHPVFLLEPE